MSIHKRTYKKANGTVSTYYLAIVKLRGLKPITKQFERKVDAEHWERSQRVQLASDSSESVQNAHMSFEELGKRWFETYALKSLEHSTNFRYDGIFRNYLIPAFGRTRLSEIQPLRVEHWLTSMTSGTDALSPKTANNMLGLLKKMLSDAVRWGFVKFNAIACVKALSEGQQEFQFWTISEAQSYLQAIKGSDLDFYHGVALALYTGMRLGEIQALKWDSVDFRMRQIIVRRTYCLKSNKAKEWTKTKRVRRIPINESLLEILLTLKKNARSDEVLPDFPFHHASRTLKRTAREFGIKAIRFHDLRHSFASNFIMRGGDIYKLQKLLGHSSVQMTERYAHLSPEHLKDATSILDFGTKNAENVLALAKSG